MPETIRADRLLATFDRVSVRLGLDPDRMRALTWLTLARRALAAAAAENVAAGVDYAARLRAARAASDRLRDAAVGQADRARALILAARYSAIGPVGDVARAKLDAAAAHDRVARAERRYRRAGAAFDGALADAVEGAHALATLARVEPLDHVDAARAALGLPVIP